MWRRLVSDSLLLPLLAVQALTILLVSPRGDFPLADDWMYAAGVETILDTGHFTPHPFHASIFIVQAYWGALFAKIFGFSFTILRISTIVLMIVAAWAGAACARACGLSRSVCVMVGVVLLANPIAMNMSYTFMTDIPFTALTVLSGLFFLRSLRHGQPTYPFVFLGSTFAALSFFVRQFGVVLPASFVCAVAFGLWRKQYVFSWAILVALVTPWILALAATTQISVVASVASQDFDWGILGRGPTGRSIEGLRFFFVALCYLSLFVSPIIGGRLTPLLTRTEHWNRRSWIVVAALILTSALFVCTGFAPRMPLLPNLIYDLGVGTLTLNGLWINNELWRPIHIGDVWWLVTAAGITLTALSIMAVAPRLQDTLIHHPSARPRPNPHGDTQDIFLVLWLLSGVMVLFNPWVTWRYDRYLLPSIIPLAVLMARTLAIKRTKSARITGVVICLGIYLFSVACLQDYMSWNRARWEALSRLTNTYGATYAQIDGGYEVNGRYNSPHYIEAKGADAFLNQGPFGQWIIEDAYAISFVPRKDFEEIDTVPYYSWLGFEERPIRILRRTSPRREGYPF